MSFSYRNGELYAEEIALADIAARFGTPCYVYSRALLTKAYRDYLDALKSVEATICYAVKANPNIAILNLFARLGAGFDIVSGGELDRVIKAGGDPRRVVFSGVGKTRAELHAALVARIGCFNVESASELFILADEAKKLGTVAPIALRVNPDVDPKTHPYISTGLKNNKFGIAYQDALTLYRRARELPQLEIVGLACHIGSQLLDPGPAAAATEKIIALADALSRDGIVLEHLDLGGGMGIAYADEVAPDATSYLAPSLHLLVHRRERLIFAPGRSLVGAAGLLLARVEILKMGETRNFAIVDAAMNDLLRPALYDAWHDVLPVKQSSGTAERLFEVVGPICESGDFLGRERRLALAEGDLVAIMAAGAYGMSMASNYNSRPRAPEVLADGTDLHLIRERERLSDLYAHEHLLP